MISVEGTCARRGSARGVLVDGVCSWRECARGGSVLVEGVCSLRFILFLFSKAQAEGAGVGAPFCSLYCPFPWSLNHIPMSFHEIRGSMECHGNECGVRG